MGEHAGHCWLLTPEDLLQDPQDLGVLGPYKGPHTRVLGHCLIYFQWGSSAVPLMLSVLHSSCIIEHSFQEKQTPFLSMGETPP